MYRSSDIGMTDKCYLDKVDISFYLIPKKSRFNLIQYQTIDTERSIFPTGSAQHHFRLTQAGGLVSAVSIYNKDSCMAMSKRVLRVWPPITK